MCCIDGVISVLVDTFMALNDRNGNDSAQGVEVTVSVAHGTHSHGYQG